MQNSSLRLEALTSWAWRTSLVLTLAGCASPTFAARSGAGPESAPATERAVVVVRVARPWYAPRFFVRGKFRDVRPDYEAIAPLEAKYFTISDEGAFGGIYLWTTRSDAEHHFDAAWRANVRKKRGVDADVLVLDAPVVIAGGAVPGGEPVGARSVAFPAWASLVRYRLDPGVDAGGAVKVLTASVGPVAELFRAFVVQEPGSVGLVGLWATREAAEAATSGVALARVAASVGGRAGAPTLFEAPLLIDATLRNGR